MTDRIFNDFIFINEDLKDIDLIKMLTKEKFFFKFYENRNSNRLKCDMIIYDKYEFFFIDFKKEFLETDDDFGDFINMLESLNKMYSKPNFNIMILILLPEETNLPNEEELIILEFQADLTKSINLDIPSNKLMIDSNEKSIGYIKERVKTFMELIKHYNRICLENNTLSLIAHSYLEVTELIKAIIYNHNNSNSIFTFKPLIQNIDINGYFNRKEKDEKDGKDVKVDMITQVREDINLYDIDKNKSLKDIKTVNLVEIDRIKKERKLNRKILDILSKEEKEFFENHLKFNGEEQRTSIKNDGNNKENDNLQLDYIAEFIKDFPLRNNCEFYSRINGDNNDNIFNNFYSDINEDDDIEFECYSD